MAEQIDDSFKKGNDLDENKTEIGWKPNLLTDYKRTIAFMIAIESRMGQGWPENQPEGMYKNTLAYVMNWLNTAPTTERAVILYGWEGGDRYLVLRDGSVKFLASFSVEKTLSQAKALNFPIDY